MRKDLKSTLAVCLLTLAAACSPIANPARADAAPPYAAIFSGQCCFETIESGAIEKQFFTLTNIGTVTWGDPETFSVNLATDSPEGHDSIFAAPDWPLPSRPVIGVRHPVSPGAAYKFAFDVKAPAVSQPTVYVETFALVAEGYKWLDIPELGPLMWLEYRVLPATPPTISLTLSRSAVTAGESFEAQANANAVASLNHISLQFAGQQTAAGPPRDPEITGDAKSSWTASSTFNTNNLGGGPQTVVATAYDDAGLSTTTTATIDVQNGAPPPPAPQPGARTPVTRSPRMYFAGTTLPGSRSHLRLTRIVIIGTGPGESVFASCHRCRGKSKLGPKTARGAQVTLTPRNLVVTRHSKLVVYVTSPGIDGRYKVYAIDVQHAAAKPRQQGCLAPGGTQHTPCPG